MTGNAVTPKWVEQGNAQKIREVCLGIIPFVMLRYEAIALFLTEEPCLIHIHESKESDRRTLEQVFRLRMLIPNTAIYSWCVYSCEREWFDPDGNVSNLIIRHVAWDRARDLTRYQTIRDKDIDKVQREKENVDFLNAYPTIEAKSVYLDLDSSKKLIEKMLDIDEIIEHGISLRERKGKRPEWQDLEVKRLFDWGQIHTTWSPPMVNQKVEASMVEIEHQLRECMEKADETIYQMDLDYSIPPETYHALIRNKKVIIKE